MIEKLEMFIALANERHFGRAAQACGVTQPTLSSALKQLEGELGVQLVWRGSRFQGLTPEGQRVLEWARRIVADTRTLKDEMRAARSGLSGNLRIGVIPTALPMVVNLTAPFFRRHPNVRIAILSRSSVEILHQIESLEIDAGITYLSNEPLGRVSAVPLYTEAYSLLMHSDHPLAQKREVTWQEVSREQLCLLTAEMQNRRIINQHLAEIGAEATPSVESNSVVALIAHVTTGGWVSVVTRQTAALFTTKEVLSAVPIRSGSREHQVGLIAPWREIHTPVLAALLDEANRIAQP